MTASANPLQKVFDEAFATIDVGREAFSARLAPHEIGAVTYIAVGIAKVSGLPGTAPRNCSAFPAGSLASLSISMKTKSASCCSAITTSSAPAMKYGAPAALWMSLSATR